MKLIKVKTNKLKPNNGQIEGLPTNPRYIKDDKFKKLVNSLKDDPEMMELREPIVYDNHGEFVVICGNQRLMVLNHLKIKDVVIKLLPVETPLEKLKAYTIKDNVPFGEHDWEGLANEWDSEKLDEWGIDVPNYDIKTIDDEEIEKSASLDFKIVCETTLEQEALMKMFKTTKEKITYSKFIELIDGIK